MRALEAEQAVIGIALFDSTVLDRVAHLKPEHFSEALHAQIWGMINDDRVRGALSSPTTLSPRLAGGAIDALGGIAYLIDLIDQSPPPSAVTDNAAAVINAWQMREIMRSSSEAVKATDALEALSALKSELTRIEGASGGEDESTDALDAATEHLTHLYEQVASGKASGLMTGLKFIDDRVGGLKPGHVLITGGRPSMGKTAVSRNIAFGCARLNPDYQVVFYALEMSKAEMSERSLSQLTFESGFAVPYKDISNPTTRSLDAASRVAGDMPRNLIINDRSRMTVDDVRRDAFKRASKAKLALIVIDYVQLLTMPDVRGKSDAKLISEMTAEFKRMAKELNCAILLVVQLNRNLESRDNKRPQMSDLRDSGGFEQDANAIFFPFREYVYKKNSPPPNLHDMPEFNQELEAIKYDMKIICAKNRGGETGDDEMWCSMAHDVVLNERPSYWRGA